MLAVYNVLQMNLRRCEITKVFELFCIFAMKYDYPNIFFDMRFIV